MKKLFLTSIASIFLSVALVTPAFAGFKDVDGNASYNWAKPSIDVMNERGVLTGYPDGTFRPAMSVTKAQFTVMVYRLFPLLHHPDPQAISGVPVNHWASKEFSELYSTIWPIYAADVQDFNSDSEYVYKPDKQMTRWEVMMTLDALFARMDGLDFDLLASSEIANQLSAIKDIPVTKYASYDTYEQKNLPISLMSPKMDMTGNNTNTDWATDLDYLKASALYRFVKHGIITPNSNGYFYPNKAVSRAEIVTILNRMLTVVGEEYAYIEEQEDESLSGSYLHPGGETGFGGTLQSNDIYETIILAEAPEWAERPGTKLENVKIRIHSAYPMDVFVTVNGETTKYTYEQFSNNSTITLSARGAKFIDVEGKARFPEQLDADGYYPVMIYVGDPEFDYSEYDDEWLFEERF